MLKFDSKGFLKPYQPIPCSIVELKTHFVDAFVSENRHSHFAKYIKYSDDLKKLLGGTKFKQWINGSFATKKNNPKDIDFISFIEHDLVSKLGDKLIPFKPDNSWEIYGVDAYLLEVHPAGSKEFKMFTLADQYYWHKQFTRTRRNRVGTKHPKGFLQIIY